MVHLFSPLPCRATVLTMTNFPLISEFERASQFHGGLVPERSAHLFAGVSRSRWKRLPSVPVIVVGGVKFVSLLWLRRRRTWSGRLGISYGLRTGLIKPDVNDRPLAYRLRCEGKL